MSAWADAPGHFLSISKGDFMSKVLKNQNLRSIVLVGAFFALVLGISLKVFAATPDSRSSIGFVGASSIQNPNFSGSSNASGAMGLGGGLALQIALDDRVAIEAEMLYLSHKFSRDTAEVFGT